MLLDHGASVTLGASGLAGSTWPSRHDPDEVLVPPLRRGEQDQVVDRRRPARPGPRPRLRRLRATLTSQPEDGLDAGSLHAL